MSTHQKVFTLFTVMLLLGIGGTSTTYAQTLSYHVTEPGKEHNEEIDIIKSKNGYLVKRITVGRSEMTYHTDPSFSVFSWKYSNLKNGTDISAIRSENMISIAGQLKNEKYEKEFKIDDLPWYQEWGLGLKAFIQSDKNSTRYWSIDPNKLRIATFEAKKKKIEIIKNNGEEIESIYVKISLTGFLKLFWSADMWFRRSDGTHVYSRMKRGPVGPIMTVQLIKEYSLR